MRERAVTFSTLGLEGRLGNQLWQIAAVIGRSLERGLPIRLPPWAYADAFSLPSSWFALPGQDDVEVYDLVDYLVPANKFVMQDIRLWWRFEQQVREYLTPAKHVLDEVDALYGDVLERGDVTAVHVRRGDYLHYPHVYPLPTADYYRTAIERFGSSNIIVFTDDPEWVSSNLTFLEGARMTCWPAAFLDLACMTRCSRLVIANSSFSWWGAFLSGSTEIVRPRYWYTPEIHARDPALVWLVPDHWTPGD
ncbi:alpha-1,2-fucosyltransferase [Kutzneria buriramensis]|uniref:Glycosyl transferase family 11 n=1 Tax=Kutzneria buriramensis TaxID=1045776 RepID=A0A3E0H2X9_9PSEU|nr:alpha-1,2-fucosyltransferase [Kutzneria buriramensis]REH36380.1 glycosyl transferase family 11 [Kutzneria buriramensis]